MIIKDLKDFQKFLRMCRAKGVQEITFDGVGVKFGYGKMDGEDDDEDDDQSGSEGLSPDEMAFYHLSGEK